MASTDYERSEKGLAVLNAMDEAKLPKLMGRLSQRLRVYNEDSFTEEEKGKLVEVFDIEMDDVNALLGLLSHILKQAAYHNWKPAALVQHLSSIKVETGHGVIISQAWQKYGKDIVARLKKKTLTANQLEKVDWHLNLQVAQGSKSKITEPNVVFQLQVNGNMEGGSNTFLMEFGHEELLKFYNKLEVIQEQLDALS